MNIQVEEVRKAQHLLIESKVHELKQVENNSKVKLVFEVDNCGKNV